MHSQTTLFPMMGVGVFNIMFWIGFVVGHDVGFACDGMLLTALLLGSLGCYAVVKLERLGDGTHRRQRTRQPGVSDTPHTPGHTGVIAIVGRGAGA